MATYKEIHGINVQYRDSDAPETEGDVWYNASTGLLKMHVLLGSWASGGNLNTGRGYARCAGIQTANVCFAGVIATNTLALTEEYDGSSWTEVGDLNKARGSVAGFGTQTAAVCTGGDEYPSPTRNIAENEEWDGSSWSEVTNLPATKAGGSSAGIITAGLVFGGGTPGPVATTFEYDGTNWTAGGDTNTDHGDMGYVSAGTQTAALGAGGAPGPTANCELYDGSSWTETANLNTASNQGGGGGTQTSAIAGGSQQAPQAKTESWDGTSWSELADISTARYASSGCAADNTSALMTSGVPGYPLATEEWDVSLSIETVAFD